TVWVIRLDGDHLNPAALERALRLGRQAVELDPLLPEAHAALGAVLTWLGFDPLWWTSSERRIRCPNRWPTRRRAGVPAGGLTRSPRRRRCGWCSTRARASAPRRAIWI